MQVTRSSESGRTQTPPHSSPILYQRQESSLYYPEFIQLPWEHLWEAATPREQNLAQVHSLMSLSTKKLLQGLVWRGKPQAKPDPQTAPNGPDLPQSYLSSTEDS